MRGKLKRLTAVFLSILMAFTGVLPSAGGPPVVYAETMERPSRTFYLYDDKTLEAVNPGSDCEVKIYTGSSYTNSISGSLSFREDAVKFTADEAVDSEKKYYYGIKVAGYDWCYGGPFTFGEADFYVLLHKTAPGTVRMILDNNGKDFLPEEVFFTVDGTSVQIPFNGTGYDFSSYKAGDVIEYTVKKDGYADGSGSFALENGDQKIRVALTRKPDLGFDLAAVTKTYGDEDFLISDAITHTEGYDGKITYTQKSGEDVISVKEDGTVSILGVGSAVVTMTGDSTENFNGTSEDVRIYVEQKDLGTITSDMIEWEQVEKVYNGDVKATVKGKLKADCGLVDEDEFIITAAAILDGADVGIHTSKISMTEVSGAENYIYEIGEITGPDVTVTPKEILFHANNFSVDYASDAWKNICDGNIPEGTSVRDAVTIDTELTAEDKKNLEEIDFASHLNVYVIADRYKVGTAEDVVFVAVKDELAGNYKFAAAENSAADVTVSAQKTTDTEVWDLITIDDASESVSTDGTTIYIRPHGKLVLKTKDTLLYDTVNVIESYPEAAKDYSNVLYAPETAKTGSVIANIYLSDSQSPDTRTQSTQGHDNRIPEGAVRIDADYPELTFTDGTGIYAQSAKGGDPSFNTLTFDHLVREKGYTLTAVSTDKESGVKDSYYSIIEIKNADDASQAVLDAVNTDQTKWTSLPDDGSIKVPGTKTGYYIVLIKTSDNVGNEAVYASNGVVIDTTEPVLTVSGIDSSTVYGSDVTYSVTLGDPEDINGVKTGIDKVIVTVEKDGKKVEGSKYIDSYELSASDIYNNTAGNATFDGFAISSADKTFNGKITAANSNSNDVVLVVKVIDKAGNEIISTTHLKIDATAPKINVSYDGNTPKNGTYFNQDRLMTVLFTERNFEEARASFSIEVDGVKGNYTIAQIREGKVDGVYLAEDRRDSESDIKDGHYTDARTNQYIIGFGGNGTPSDHDYTVSVAYRDPAGNESTVDYGDSTAPESFTVDEIAPQLTVIYTNSNGEDVPVGTDAGSPYYDQSSMAATLSVTERNFRNSDIEVVVSATDAEGNVVENAYTDASVKAPQTGIWKTSGKTNTFAMDSFKQEANYGISVSYTDLAGNEAKVYETRYFTVDKTAPTGTIFVKKSDGTKIEYSKAVEDRGSGGILQFIFNLFFDKKIDVETDAKDVTAGLKSVSYHLVAVDGNAGDTFSADADFQNMSWTEWEDDTKVSVKEDEIALIYVRMEDKAGHVSYISSDGGIIVDTKNPDKPVVTVEDTEEYHKNDFSVNISATDPDNGGEGVFAGMKSISYQVFNKTNGQASEVKNIASAKNSRVRTLQGDAKITADGFNSNNVLMRIEAVDFAGNTTIEEKSYIVDATAPVVSWDMDTSDVKNGAYYNKTKQMSVTIKERNFDPDGTVLTAVIDGEQKSFTFSELVNGDAGAYGLTANLRSDTQERYAKEDRTDERKVTYLISFGFETDAEHAYKNLTITSDDLAGNSGKADASDAIIIDKIAPVLTISYSDGEDRTKYVTTNSASPYYSNQDMNVEISITETNFKSDALKMTLTQKTSTGKDVNVYRAGSLKPESMSWSDNGNVHTAKMDVFSGDAIFGLQADFTDLAGNKAVTYDRHYFCVDKTAPTGSLTVTGDDGKKTYSGLSGTATFEFVSSSPVAVVQYATDNVSGIASVKYYKYVPAVDTSGTFQVPKKEALRDVKWIEWDKSLSVSPDSQAVIYAKITDKSGNITYINTEGAIIADKTSPAAPEIEIKSKAETGVFGGNVSVGVSVEDKVSGGTYAGLQSVTIEVLKDGKVTQTDTWETSSKARRQKNCEMKMTVEADKNNSNNVIVRVTAVDFAGNQSSNEERIAIDKTAPGIEVIYNNNNPSNGKYYNDVRTATVRVYERNFDKDGVTFDFTGTDGASPSVSGWTIGDSAGRSDNNVSTCTITYSADSDYTFTMAVTDKAGNKSELGRTDAFTIDRTKPVISVAFDSNSVNGKYYNKTRTATITVNEHNFDAAGFSAEVSATVNGKSVQAPSLSGWSHNGDIHTATIQFSEDADYSFILNCTDLAGNKADTYTQENFTVDANAPEIEFFDIEDGSANNGIVAPGVRFTDVNFSSNNIVMTLKGLKHKEVEVTGDYTAITGGGQVKLSDFKHEAAEDDIYTLTAKVTDLAGNETEKSITFSVNRFGSNYSFDEKTETYLLGYYQNKPSELVIYETNVDSLKSKGISVIYDGSAINLSADAFKVEDVSEKNDWKKYKYTIEPSIFTEEGLYEIIINSTDAAGNRQDNKLKDAAIAFVLDKTAPSAVITGIEDGEIYDGKSRMITVRVTDDQAIGTLKLMVDGEEVGNYSAKDIESVDGKISYELKEAGNWQKVSAKVTDAAGNESKTDTVSVLLTTSSFVRFINSTAFKVGILAVVIIAAAVFILLLAKKRKKAEDENSKNGSEKIEEIKKNN